MTNDPTMQKESWREHEGHNSPVTATFIAIVLVLFASSIAAVAVMVPEAATQGSGKGAYVFRGDMSVPWKTAGLLFAGYTLIMLIVWRDSARGGLGRRRAIGWRGVKKTTVQVVLLIAGSLIAIWSVNALYALFIGLDPVSGRFPTKPTPSFRIEDVSPGLSFLFMILFGIAHVVQELVFRGYLQTMLASRMPAWASIAVASIAYVSYHALYLQAVWWPMIFVVGLGIGTVFHLTRSLWPAILLSLLYSLLTVSF